MRRENVPSSYVGVEINNAIFGLLGVKSFSLATGFAEIFSANEQQDGWLKLGAGVICYVKDYSQRNVSLRVFNVDGQVREIWNTSVAPEDLFFKDTPNFVMLSRSDGMLIGINFTHSDEAEGFFAKVQQLQSRRPQRLISNVDDDEETIESAPVPVTQSSAARCDARRISSDAFRDELSAVIMRNRDRALLRTTIPSRVSSVTVKWMHEGTYRRFTLSYDDECDAYQALIDELSRFKSNFNGRLEWNGNNSSTETVYFQEEITSQQC
uniref:WH1 domain-containing protein n=1 Tax=Ascaris lumbricoides TaxID=6252 RepID=A0A0M3HVR1_ASCLU